MYLTRKNQLETLFLRLLLETGPAILRGHPSHPTVKPLALQREYLHFLVNLRP